MKRLAVAVVVLLLTAGVAFAKDYEITKKAGEYSVEVKIGNNPAVVGNNDFEVRVKDASGKSVTDAKVVVEYSMPAMPGMPAMNYKAPAELKGSEYKGKMNVPMSGSWSVAVKIMRAGKTAAMKFMVDAK